MSEYTSIPSTGKLKLKGVKDSKIDKKKKKKKSAFPEQEDDNNNSSSNDNHGTAAGTSTPTVLEKLEDEDDKILKNERRNFGIVDGQPVVPGAGVEGEGEGQEDLREHLKTEAEKRYDEQRRKRLEKRLEKEGVKTHKQRVEELNKYLSNLSEHHDMPKIGPG